MLGMVWTDAKVGKQQLLSARMRTSPVRFDGHEISVNVVEGFGIVRFQNPALLAYVIFIEDAEAARWLLVRSFPPPRLKGSRVLNTRLRIQIERIEDQRLALGVKDPAVRLFRSSL